MTKHYKEKLPKLWSVYLACQRPMIAAPLTRRQCDVLRLICQGCPLPVIARQLEIARATAEKRRQHVSDILRTDNDYYSTAQIRPRFSEQAARTACRKSSAHAGSTSSTRRKYSEVTGMFCCWRKRS